METDKKAYVTCKVCGHRFLVTPADFRAERVVIYRGGGGTRTIECPNCQRRVYVDVPKGWLDDE
ncbi:MAG: hypothetical protein ACPG8W_23690 [Candidatus Promineifilaceae bacterium]